METCLDLDLHSKDNEVMINVAVIPNSILVMSSG